MEGRSTWSGPGLPAPTANMPIRSIPARPGTAPPGFSGCSTVLLQMTWFTIALGIFTTSGLLMQDLHNPLLMISLWVVAGIIALSGALCYGEVGAAIPKAGGEYTFLSQLFHPMYGFLSGWLSFFAGFSAPIAASAIGFSEYFTRAFPGVLSLGIFPESMEASIMRKLIAIFITSLFAGIAGVLFVVLEGSVFPDLLFWVMSLEVFVMCLLGGWLTFAGPVLGAAIIVSLRTFVGVYTEYWTLILGIILILIIFFLPEGIMGFILEKLNPQTEDIVESG